MSSPWSVNCVKAGECELCLPLPKVFIHYAESRSVWLLSESLENTENLHIQFSHFPSDWSKITQILQNCNKSLYNELHHISTTSLAGFSTSSNEKPQPTWSAKILREKRMQNKQNTVFQIFVCVEGSWQDGRERQKRETDRESINKTWLHDFPTSKRQTQEGALPEQ